MSSIGRFEVRVLLCATAAAGLLFLLLPRRQSSIQGGSSSKSSSSSKSKGPTSPKSYAAFLSHFKRECGSEALLVHNELAQILPKHKKVFLDSGEL